MKVYTVLQCVRRTIENVRCVLVGDVPSYLRWRHESSWCVVVTQAVKSSLLSSSCACDRSFFRKTSFVHMISSLAIFQEKRISAFFVSTSFLHIFRHQTQFFIPNSLTAHLDKHNKSHTVSVVYHNGRVLQSCPFSQPRQFLGPSHSPGLGLAENIWVIPRLRRGRIVGGFDFIPLLHSRDLFFAAPRFGRAGAAAKTAKSLVEAQRGGGRGVVEAKEIIFGRGSDSIGDSIGGTSGGCCSSWSSSNGEHEVGAGAAADRSDEWEELLQGEFVLSPKNRKTVPSAGAERVEGGRSGGRCVVLVRSSWSSSHRGNLSEELQGRFSSWSE